MKSVQAICVQKLEQICCISDAENRKGNILDKNGEKHKLTDLPLALPDQEGFSAVWHQNQRGFFITLPHGELFYSPRLLDERISDRYIEYFLENDKYKPDEINWRELNAAALNEISFKNILWKQDYINLYGRKALPRLTSWYGDAGKVYTYSAIRSEPNPWNEGLLYIKQEIERVSKTRFNSVLLNWYRNGEDYMSWHADDEKELGINPVIASVNFGETRDFILRSKSDMTLKIRMPLEHGTLLIMRGALQHHWEHSVPKRLSVKKSRFNLTFRNII